MEWMLNTAFAINSNTQLMVFQEERRSNDSLLQLAFPVTSSHDPPPFTDLQTSCRNTDPAETPIKTVLYPPVTRMAPSERTTDE
jgi:hypothetical protein